MQTQETPLENPLNPPRILDFTRSEQPTRGSFDENITKKNPREDRRKTIADLRLKFKLEPISVRAQNLAGEDVEKEEETKDEEGKAVSKKSKKFHELFKQLDIIGQGATAVVKRIERIETKEILVAKIVRSQDPEDHDQLRKEFNFLKKIEHKNIIKVEDLLVDNQAETSQIIMEYFPGNTLFELITKKKKIEESTLKIIIEQVVSALEYLHTRGLCHRDITPSNILVNANNQVKLIDFSVAKIFRSDLWSPLVTLSSFGKKKHPTVISTAMISDAGTDAYKAPEIIKGIPYTQAVDMWSLGCVTFYALVGYKPFYSKDLEKLNELILSNKCKWDPVAWEKVSYEARIFVTSCLNKFSFFRLSSQEFLAQLL